MTSLFSVVWILYGCTVLSKGQPVLPIYGPQPFGSLSRRRSTMRALAERAVQLVAGRESDGPENPLQRRPAFSSSMSCARTGSGQTMGRRWLTQALGAGGALHFPQTWQCRATVACDALIK